jgi:predicted nucleic acid-binding Zn ribbon protein
MWDRGELRGLGDVLGPVLSRLGIDDLPTLLSIMEEWDTLAGGPWAEHTRPVVLRRGTLVVEASNPMAIRMLKFGEVDLLRSLQDRFGVRAVSAVEVVRPST